MLYFITHPDDTVQATESHKDVDTARAEGLTIIDRWSLTTFPQAEALAKWVNASAPEGVLFLATDAGPSTSPRFDVIKAPKIGDPISYGFNGDYYPDGTIVSVGTGKKMVVVSSEGTRYYRRRQSRSWVKQGGTFTLVHGTISRMNRER